MHFAPPSCSNLDHLAGSLAHPNLCARVCCLFVNGTFGVWEVDSRNELRAVRFLLHSSCIHSANVDESKQELYSAADLLVDPL